MRLVDGIKVGGDEGEGHIHLTRLGQLQRRIRDECNRKQKQRDERASSRGNKLNTDPALHLLRRGSYNDGMGVSAYMLNDSVDYDDVKVREKGRTRRQKYDNLIHLQNMSSIMIQEYLQKTDERLEKKVRDWSTSITNWLTQTGMSSVDLSIDVTCLFKLSVVSYNCFNCL